VDVGARHTEGGYVLRHPLEVATEAVGALSSGCGLGDMSGGRVGFSQEGSQQQHRGPRGNHRELCFDICRFNGASGFSSSVS